MSKLTANITPIGLIINEKHLIARFGSKVIYEKFLKKHTVVEIESDKMKRMKVKPSYHRLQSLVPYTIEGEYIIFPRYFAHILKTAIEVLNDYAFLYRTIEIEHELGIKLEVYQVLGSEHICETLLEKNHAYLQLPPGFGKTIMGIHIMVRMKVASLVVVPTKHIASQWIDDAKKAYPTIKIALFSNDQKNPPTGLTHDIVVIIINTFREKTPEFVKMHRFGLIMFDEAHELKCESGIKSLGIAQCFKYIVGLSATPYNTPTGLDVIVTKYLGLPIDITKLEGCALDMPKFTTVVKAIRYSGDPEYVIKEQTAIETIKNFVKDPARIALIVDEILDLKSRGHGVLVFSELRSHLDMIKAALIERVGNADDIDDSDGDDNESVMSDESLATAATADSGCDTSTAALTSVVLRGGATPEDVQSAKSGSHIILTTYGYSRRGVSIVELTALILATPRRANTVQILGRITRKGSNVAIIREVVDIVDMGSGLQGQYTDRRRVYGEMGSTVTEIEVSAPKRK